MVTNFVWKDEIDLKDEKKAQKDPGLAILIRLL